MMIDPPIDKLIKKAPCRYALVVAVTKRTKEILSQEESENKGNGEKAVSCAAREIYNGDIKIVL